MESTYERLGIDAEPAFDGREPHVFVYMTDWAVNGLSVQSKPLTIADVDYLIDQLIDAQRIARRLRDDHAAPSEVK